MALEAMQALGGNGYINDFPTGRLVRDAKLYEIGAGTSEIRRMLIGRELFDATCLRVGPRRRRDSPGCNDLAIIRAPQRPRPFTHSQELRS